MCIFESDTVKSDRAMQDLKMVSYTCLTVCSGDIKKKNKSSGNEKKSSENDQSTGHFQCFF